MSQMTFEERYLWDWRRCPRPCRAGWGLGGGVPSARALGWCADTPLACRIQETPPSIGKRLKAILSVLLLRRARGGAETGLAVQPDQLRCEVEQRPSTPRGDVAVAGILIRGGATSVANGPAGWFSGQPRLSNLNT
jgi:hypothetical protein